MQISALRLSLLMLLPLLTGAGTLTPLAEERQWRLISDRQGIQVYQPARVPDSRLRGFRGVTRLRVTDEYALVALLEDYAAYPDWLHLVDGVQVLNRDAPGPRRLRLTTRMPWPLTNRDAILESHVSQGRGTVVVSLLNRPATLPPAPDYLRVPALSGELRFERVAPDQVEVVYQLLFDPGGRIPGWLTEVLLRETPHFTLERLNRVVRRPRYQGHYYPELDLNGPGRPSSENVTKNP
ncbi:START domain-containing protein [Alloalcanivorax sp. C16-2]|uniref:START domain-containing protein n=1 Tax=Alloalcanivorax sp. C16-2 TaxID=3390052 RepID=UPI003970A1CB